MNDLLLESISDDELDSLSLEELVRRMDEVLAALRKRPVGRGDPIDAWPEDARRVLRPTIGGFAATQTVAALDPTTKRRVSHRFFAYLIQLELTFTAFASANDSIWTPAYDNTKTFRSPKVRRNLAALEQYVIISSRIAVEILFDLIYDLGTRRPLPSGNRSRLKVFRKWLLKAPELNPYVYFAGTALAVYRFDRRLRSPEIHGASKYPRRLLLLKQRDFEEVRGTIELINQLGGVLGPLFDILDGRFPGQFSPPTDVEFMDAYRAKDPATLSRRLELLFAEMTNAD